ncbi:Retrovirus-related Pol polyprotein from transposon 412 [Araneus ventricosus]|uniref:Retrovirus-related Pol polyprotein from transposon 412 n=1 Tax=Araneus ventricosus TaxID=182803 RepID=A0A4Y2TNJ4_ARAVE|nr:Retrovirus-related Pol polyprotein from transposon 412 [Araneus ventricosus]
MCNCGLEPAFLAKKLKSIATLKQNWASLKYLQGRFCVVHIDLIGPLPPSRGNIYCLTCIDRFSNWMEAIPLDNISADTVARAFYSNWIARFGTPHKLITDRGTQFRSETLQTLSKICGIKLQHTTAYHLACNGKVERRHRTLKTALKAHNNLSWIDTLPTVLLGLRTAIQEDNNHSIAQIVYGESLRLPGEFFSEPSIQTASEGFANNLQKQMETVGPRTTRRNSSRHIFVHKDLENCSHVFQRIDRVKKQLESPYEGPFPVIERQDKYFTINIKGKHVNVSLDRLKPAYILAEDNSKATTTDHVKLQTSDNKPDLTQKQSRTGRTIRLPVRFKD